MPAPQPLTASPAPTLDWSRPGVPAAKTFGDVYFSTDGGLEECRTVFLTGCGLPAGWMNTPTYAIGELGFGSGLNFLTTWQMWDDSQAGGHLHFISVEKFPFTRDELLQALSVWPELKVKANSLAQLWPGRVKGFHRLHIAENVTLTLIHDDIHPALNSLDAHIDAWFLDGFSPAKNPDMWSETAMKALAKLSKLGTRLASFSVAGTVRTALSNAGFTVIKKPGFGRKRHRLEAVYSHPTSSQTSSPHRVAPKVLQTRRPIKPVIIGGGIAGASIARAFLRHGIVPTICEPDQALGLENGRAASGNPAAIIKPRLDLQDRPEARFFLASYLHALSAYQDSGAVLHQGIHHIAKSVEDVARFTKLMDQAPLSSDHFEVQGDTIMYKSALVIRPQTARAHFTHGASYIHARVKRLDKTPQGWALYNKKDALITHTSEVILCAGADISQLKIQPIHPDFMHNLRYSRGQLTWAQADARLPTPLTYGGYAIPLNTGILLGATHARLSDDAPYALRQDDDLDNFNKFQQFTGFSLMPGTKTSRASIRVTSSNTLPRAGLIDEGLWGLSGLGSRGFVFAPLLGEHIVSHILNSPRPLEKAMSDRFSFQS